jgi:trans-aconitate 2-methyltransferase
VRHFTQSTAVRPVAERLDSDELAAFLAAYDAALAKAYPAELDGTVLMPFRRLFFVLSL